MNRNEALTIAAALLEFAEDSIGNQMASAPCKELCKRIIETNPKILIMLSCADDNCEGRKILEAWRLI